MITVSDEAVQTFASLDVVTRVVDLQPAEDGGLWVLNAVAPYFIRLGPNGGIERRFGNQGDGPEEFGAPMAVVRTVNPEEIWAYDRGRHALIRIAPAERIDLAFPSDTVPMPSLISFKGAGINPAPPWIESAGGGFLMARARETRYESALHLWNADVVSIDADRSGMSIDLHMPIADLVGDPRARFPDATILLPYPLWTSCAAGSMSLYDPLGNTLRQFTKAGEELSTIGLPHERQVQVTADLVFDMFYRQIEGDVPSGQMPGREEMRRLTEEQNRDVVINSAEFFPEYTDLRCASDGSRWLRRFDPTNGRLGHGSDWLRVSDDGSLTAIALPRAFRTFRLDRDRIWGTMKDALGVDVIVWISMDAAR